MTEEMTGNRVGEVEAQHMKCPSFESWGGIAQGMDGFKAL